MAHSKKSVNVQSLFVMGRRASEEVLRSHPKRIEKVYTSLKESDLFLQRLKEKNISIEFCERDKLARLVDSESHQSIVLRLANRPFQTVDWAKNLLDQEERLLFLALDSITDPQNMGAILRAAECFGIHGVIWSKNRGCPITPVVSKTSVGATELVPLIPVSNLAEALNCLKREGFQIVTADCSNESVPLREFSFSRATVLVMGSEGKGVRSLLKKNADASIEIPMAGSIDSLNVSQATAVILSHWVLN